MNRSSAAPCSIWVAVRGGMPSLWLCLGAASVTAVDFQAKSYRRAEEFCKRRSLPVRFGEADVLQLPFADRSFDFVFSNGVLHHTRSWQAALDEYLRGDAAIGLFVPVRDRRFFLDDAAGPAAAVPSNPAVLYGRRARADRHAGQSHDLHGYVVRADRRAHCPRRIWKRPLFAAIIAFLKLPSRVETDLDCAIARGIPGAALCGARGSTATCSSGKARLISALDLSLAAVTPRRLSACRSRHGRPDRFGRFYRRVAGLSVPPRRLLRFGNILPVALFPPICRFRGERRESSVAGRRALRIVSYVCRDTGGAVRDASACCRPNERQVIERERHPSRARAARDQVMRRNSTRERAARQRRLPA